MIRGRVSSALAATVGTSVAIQALNVISGVALARALGPTDRGGLAAAMLWPMVLSAVGTLGIAEAVVFFTSRAGHRDQSLSTAFVVAGPQVAVIVAVGYLALPTLLGGVSPELLATSRAFLMFVPLNLLSLYAVSYLQGRRLFGWFNFARLSFHLAYTVAVVLLTIMGGLSVPSAISAFLISAGVVVVAAIGLAVASSFRLERMDWPIVRSLLSFGLRSHVGSLASIAASRVDLVILVGVASQSAIGNYVVATTIAGAASLIPSAAATVLYPRVVAGGEAERQRLAAVAIKGGVLYGLVSTLAMLAAVPFVLPVLFGPSFSSAVSTAMILVGAASARGLVALVAAVFRGRGEPWMASQADLVSVIVMTVVLPFSVPALGANGAAIAVLLGAISACVWAVSRLIGEGYVQVHDLRSAG